MPPVTLPLADTTEPNKLDPVTVPVALTNPAVVILPPTTFAAEVIVEVADIKPAVNILPPVTLPVTVTSPAVVIFPPITLPDALTTAPRILDPVTVPVALNRPAVNKFAPAIFPVTLNTLPTVLNVNADVAAKLPPLLNGTCVFAPGAVTLPLILPANVPTKNPAVVILPVALT